MGRFTGKKNRIARRFGVNIFGRARSPLLHKPNPPGVHGARRRKKSDFGLQLEEKQKLKAVYGMIREKQLVNYYKKASQHGGNTATNFIQLLECRLDNIVYRIGFASTIFAAQQLVAHGHITVDGKKVDIRSFQVKPGMTIAIKEKSRNNKAINETIANASRKAPSYLSVNLPGYTGQLLALPSVEEMPLPIELNLAGICDFLAHNT